MRACLRDKYCQQYLLPLCDRVLIVCTQTLGSVRSAREIVPPKDANAPQDGKFGLIVTKYDPDIELLPAQIGSRLGIPVVGTVPTSWVSIANSHNVGVPLVLTSPGHRYARAIRELATARLDLVPEAAGLRANGGMLLGMVEPPQTRGVLT